MTLTDLLSEIKARTQLNFVQIEFHNAGEDDEIPLTPLKVYEICEQFEEDITSLIAALEKAIEQREYWRSAVLHKASFTNTKEINDAEIEAILKGEK